MRAPATARGLAAEPGVARLARDHSANDALSMRSPPQRCAAQPPGICMARGSAEGWVADDLRLGSPAGTEGGAMRQPG